MLRIVRAAGFHAHIGSQILDSDSFEICAARLIELLSRYRDAFSRLPELDLGGGYGIAYYRAMKS